MGSFFCVMKLKGQVHKCHLKGHSRLGDKHQKFLHIFIFILSYISIIMEI